MSLDRERLAPLRERMPVHRERMSVIVTRCSCGCMWRLLGSLRRRIRKMRAARARGEQKTVGCGAMLWDGGAVRRRGVIPLKIKRVGAISGKDLGVFRARVTFPEGMGSVLAHETSDSSPELCVASPVRERFHRPVRTGGRAPFHAAGGCDLWAKVWAGADDGHFSSEIGREWDRCGRGGERRMVFQQGDDGRDGADESAHRSGIHAFRGGAWESAKIHDPGNPGGYAPGGPVHSLPCEGIWD